MRPLTPEQNRIITDYIPQIKKWIAETHPLASAARDLMEADALFALCCAIATWKGGSDTDRDLYVWKSVHNFRRKAWREEQRHRHGDYPADGIAAEENHTSRELDDLIAALPEQEAKILDLIRAGFTVSEIKDILGKSKSTVCRRIRAAKDAARKLFGE